MLAPFPSDSVSSGGETCRNMDATPPPSARDGAALGPSPAPASSENKVMIMGYDVVFPAGKKPFPAQLAVMNKVLLALKTGQHALLESPTGSGKTLALLCSSLTFQRQFVKDMMEAEHVREQQKAEKKPKSEAVKQEDGDAADELRARVKSERGDDDDDDFAATQPSFDQFRFGNGATLQDDGWISMGDKKRAAEEAAPTPPVKKRQLPTSFQQAVKKEESDLDFQGSMEDFHSTAQRTTNKRVAPPKIFFCSRTHSQLAQVVDELKSCPVAYLSSPDAANPFASSLKTCVLGSKSHYCVNSKVNKDPSVLDDKCREAVEVNQCSYFRKRRKTNDLRRVVPPVWDLEDLVKLAKKHRECAFFHARDALAEANIIFCPYNYLLDPSIRDAVQISLKNAIVVLDEAHNVEDTCRSSASIELTTDALAGAIASFTDVVKNGRRPPVYLGLLKVLNGVNRWLRHIAASSSTILSPTGFEEESKVWSGTDCIAMFAEYAGMTRENFPQILMDMKAVAEYEKEISMKAQSKSGEEQEEGDDHKLSALAIGTIRSLLNVAEYMYRDDLKYLDDFKLIVMKSRSRRRQTNSRNGRGGRFSNSQSDGNEWQMKMCIWCLNAAVAFSDVVKEARSVILTSGTLSPMDSFAGELGTDFPIRLEANHVVNIRRQVFIGAVMNGPGGVDLSATYKNQQEFRYQDSMGELLWQYTQVVPGGILMFFPSYSLMDKLETRWRQTGVWNKIQQVKTIFTEPRNAGKDFDSLLDDYKRTIVECMSSLQRSGEHDVKQDPLIKPEPQWGSVKREPNENGVKFEPGQPAKTGAIFLAVYRGKVSEGIDFSNANARAVLAVGIPYPNVKELQVSLKRQYQDEKCVVDRKLVSGNAWYQLQAFRALNQALGRCIRHRKDYGAIILVDSRYRFQAHTKSLSKWIRPYVREFGYSEDCVPMLSPFFDMNANELGLGIPQLSADSTTTAVDLKPAIALKYEHEAPAPERSMQSAMDSVRAYLARQNGEDAPRVFSIFERRDSITPKKEKQEGG